MSQVVHKIQQDFENIRIGYQGTQDEVFEVEKMCEFCELLSENYDQYQNDKMNYVEFRSKILIKYDPK